MTRGDASSPIPAKNWKAAVETELGRLGNRIEALADEGIATRRLAQRDEVWMRWRLVDPKTVDGQLTFERAEGESETRQDWGDSYFVLLNLALQTDEYKHAEDELPAASWIVSPTHWFCLEACGAVLRERARPCPAFVGLMERVIAFLEGATRKSMGIARLSGIIVSEGPFRLDAGTTSILVRPLKREDLEEWIKPVARLTAFPLPRTYLYGNSAVAEIAIDGLPDRHLQDELSRLISALRLVKVCSANYSTLEMGAAEPLPIHASTLSNSPQQLSLVSARIGNLEAERLRGLAGGFWSRLPPDGLPFPGTEPNTGAVSIAYQRYVDALTLDAQVVERRMANAVVGLETLYLPEQTDGELSFRLRVSVARVMDQLGFKGSDVARDIRDAYSIRSAYVHRGHLDKEGKAKVERTSGPLGEQLIRILEYLRVSILTCIVSGARPEAIRLAILNSLSSESNTADLRDFCRPVMPFVRGELDTSRIKTANGSAPLTLQLVRSSETDPT